MFLLVRNICFSVIRPQERFGCGMIRAVSRFLSSRTVFFAVPQRKIVQGSERRGGIVRMYQHRSGSDSPAELHVAAAVADQYGLRKIDVRKVPAGLQGHTGIRLPVRAVFVPVGTVVNGVDPASAGGDRFDHSPVDRPQGLFGHHSFPDAALIGDDDDMPEKRTQHPQRFDRSIGKFEFVPRFDVIVRTQYVDDPVPIQKQRVESGLHGHRGNSVLKSVSAFS